jgi:hypothetical protein
MQIVKMKQESWYWNTVQERELDLARLGLLAQAINGH